MISYYSELNTVLHIGDRCISQINKTMHKARVPSSFNGVIEEIPNVSVDNFETTGFKAYFLSHCHTDHTNGLYSEDLLNYLKTNRVFIYTSEYSAAIIRHETQNEVLMDYIQPLKIGSTMITIPGDKITGMEDQYVTVCLLPAGHCFGSVMFLFKTLYKTILYTGDFRMSVNSVSKYAQLHENGEIIKLVDNFETTGFKAYFLSHCHTDHTNGLYSEDLLNYLKTNRVFIYTSEYSAAIIRHETQNEVLMDYIQPLKIGSTMITIPGDKITGMEDQYVTVCLLPAGHCFGSVMFLFKTLYKTILYTGDFRMSVNSVSKYAQLHENGEIIKLDALYVDTTFYSSEHDDFPKRTDSVEVVIRHIKKWLSANDTNQVALHTSAKYGYEFVYKEIYKQLNEEVYVDDDLWKLYSQFPKAVKGVTNKVTSRIHRCRNRTEKKPHDNCFTTSGRSMNAEFLFIHFSAYQWKNYQEEDSMIHIKNERRIDVCFATHCSKSEIEYFVNYLAPKKVVGFPNAYGMDEEKINLSKRAAPESVDIVSSPVKVPKMLDKDLMRKIFGD